MKQQWKGWVAVATLAVLSGCSTTGGSGDSQVDAGQGSVVEGGEGMTSGIGDGTGLEGGLSSEYIGDSGLTQNEQGLLEQKIYRFDYDSAQIKADDLIALDAHAKYLTSPAGQNLKVMIQGHTDERGAREYNLALGERRANAVKQYLELRGVRNDQLEVVSYGEERPLNPASDEQAWAENRRAVLVPASTRYGN